MVSDTRIAFVRCPNGDVVFFGGERFTAQSITDYQWLNLHHFFVDITGRVGRDLPSAFEHPETASGAFPADSRPFTADSGPLPADSSPFD
jgi:hypothetical protein